MQLGKIPTLGSHTKIYHYTDSCMDVIDNFGMLNRIAMVAKSTQIHVFSPFRRITQIIGTIYHKYSNFYQQPRKYPEYSQYSNHFPPIP